MEKKKKFNKSTKKGRNLQISRFWPAWELNFTLIFRHLTSNVKNKNKRQFSQAECKCGMRVEGCGLTVYFCRWVRSTKQKYFSRGTNRLLEGTSYIRGRSGSLGRFGRWNMCLIRKWQHYMAHISKKKFL